MLLLAIAFISALLAAILTAYLIGWLFWPRLLHFRKMQDPMAKADAEFRLMQRAISLKAQENQLVKQEAEIDMIRLKVVDQGQALFDVTQRVLHQNPMGVTSPQAMLQAPVEVVTPLIDPIAMLLAALHLMIIGFTEGGKTTLIHHLVSLWAKTMRVMVLDFDYANGMWPGAEVYTDPEPFCEKLSAEFGRRNMLRQSGQQTKFEPIRIVIDEYSAAAKNKQVSSIIELLIRRGRKYAMYVVIGIQDNQVKSLGWEGNGELRSNFAYTVEAKVDPTTRQRTLTMKPNQGDSTTVLTPNLPDAEACIKPLVPTVPNVSGDENSVPDAVPTSSSAVPVPDAVPTISVQERMTEQAKLLYRERDLEIALCIIQGMNKTATREKVGGKNEVTGKRYDEIQAELQPVSFNIKDLKTGGEQS
jgi:hypothetical protein